MHDPNPCASSKRKAGELGLLSKLVRTTVVRCEASQARKTEIRHGKHNILPLCYQRYRNYSKKYILLMCTEFLLVENNQGQ
jgi:hypothetical protein